MALDLGTLTVKLAGSTAGFSKAIEKANESLTTVGITAQNVALGATAAFAGLAAGITVVTRAASEQLAAQRSLAAAFEATGTALDEERFAKFASALQDVTTTGDEAILKLGGLLNTFGANQDQVEALIPGILDLSAATGKSADSISQALGRALGGSSGALSRYGIVLNDAEKSLIKNGNAAERTALLVQKLGKFQGQAAIQAETASGRATQLSNAFGDTLEAIGKIIDEPLAGFFQGITEAVKTVTSVIDNFSPGLRQAVAIAVLGGTAFAGVAATLAGVAAVLPAINAGLPLMAAGLAKSAKAALALGKSLLKVTIFGALVIEAIGAIKLLKESIQDIGGLRARLGIEQVPEEAGVVETAGATIGAIGKLGGAAFSEGLQAVLGPIQKLFNDFGETGVVPATDNLGNLSKQSDELDDVLRKYTKSTDKATEATGKVTEATDDLTLDFSGASDESVGLGTELQKVVGKLQSEDAILAKLIPNLDDMSTELKRVTESAADFDFQKMFGGGEDLTGGFLTGVDPSGGVVELTPQKRVEDAAERVATDLEIAGEIFGSTILAGLEGLAGDIIGAAVSGFEAGGFVGAIVGVFAELITNVKSFSAISETVSNSLGVLLEAVDPLVAAIGPVIDTISGNLTPLFESLGPLFESFGTIFVQLLGPVSDIFLALANILRPLVNAIKQVFDIVSLLLTPLGGLGQVIGAIGIVITALAIIIELAVNVIAFVINFIIDTIGEVIGVFDKDAQKNLAQFRIPVRDFGDIVEEGGASIEEAFNNINKAANEVEFEVLPQAVPTEEIFGDFGGAIEETIPPIEGLGDAAQKATDKLLNVPSGFDVVAARRRASDFGQALAASEMGAPGEREFGRGATNIGTVVVVTDDPEEFLNKLEEMEETRNFIATGSGVEAAAEFSLPEVTGANL